eukprot:1148108-Pelagomonas_calceolata.AAC.1
MKVPTGPTPGSSRQIELKAPRVQRGQQQAQSLHQSSVDGDEEAAGFYRKHTHSFHTRGTMHPEFRGSNNGHRTCTNTWNTIHVT